MTWCARCDQLVRAEAGEYQKVLILPSVDPAPSAAERFADTRNGGADVRGASAPPLLPVGEGPSEMAPGTTTSPCRLPAQQCRANGWTNSSGRTRSLPVGPCAVASCDHVPIPLAAGSAGNDSISPVAPLSPCPKAFGRSLSADGQQVPRHEEGRKTLQEPGAPGGPALPSAPGTPGRQTPPRPVAATSRTLPPAPPRRHEDPPPRRHSEPPLPKHSTRSHRCAEDPRDPGPAPSTAGRTACTARTAGGEPRGVGGRSTGLRRTRLRRRQRGDRLPGAAVRERGHLERPPRTAAGEGVRGAGNARPGDHTATTGP